MKRVYKADIQGESEHFRFTLTRTVQSSVDKAGKYSIECERYSFDDGDLLDRSFIFDDEKGDPFDSLSQVRLFIESECIDFWREKKALSDNDRDYQIATEKLSCWEQLYIKLIGFLDNEPIDLKSSIN